MGFGERSSASGCCSCCSLCQEGPQHSLTPFPLLPQASNGQWYQMNDDVVRSSNIKVVLNQQAYMLFYVR